MAVERVNIETSGSPWREEHAARYLWASGFARGAKVLDIACGTGFGSSILLREGAANVTAADISEEALDQAHGCLRSFGDRAEVRREDCLALTFPKDSFDVVTSMETVEHLPDAEAFFTEIHRVLKPGGRFLLSTPNALVTNPDGGEPLNPYHVQEFTPFEVE